MAVKDGEVAGLWSGRSSGDSTAVPELLARRLDWEEADGQAMVTMKRCQSVHTLSGGHTLSGLRLPPTGRHGWACVVLVHWRRHLNCRGQGTWKALGMLRYRSRRT